MAKLSSTELLDAFKEMTLIELSDFLKQFEETFDVTAAPRGRPSPRLQVPGSAAPARVPAAALRAPVRLAPRRGGARRDGCGGWRGGARREVCGGMSVPTRQDGRYACRGGV